MANAQQQQQAKRGIVKQILSGDTVVIRGLIGAPPPEKTISLSNVYAPKLARRGTDSIEETKDEPFAWAAREYLRKKLVGQEVQFTSEKPANSTREYGTILLGNGENVTESIVAEGLVGVRREGVKNTPELTRLWELEDAAKSAKKGKWDLSASEANVREVKWSIDNVRTFRDKSGGEPIKAIIEHVRDGSTVRALLLPDFYHVTLMISGIRCSGFKLDEKGRPDPTMKPPFADEAKYFVEIRLLQRDVEVVLETVNGNNLVGSIIHPKGNIAESLLKEGFAKCVDWSMAYVKGERAAKLRDAERHAKNQRLRLWKDYEPTPIPKNVVDGDLPKEFGGLVVEIFNGDALTVKSNDGVYRKVFLASVRPPKEVGRTADEDGNFPPRPKGFRPLYDVPYMFESREFLRKKLIGKKVHVSVDFVQEPKGNFPEKICCTVTIGGINVAEALVSKGLATVVRHRQDDDQRSSRYDDLMAAETKALKSQKNLHSTSALQATMTSQSNRIVEINDSTKARQHFASFERAPQIDACVVEHVFGATKLKVFLPKQRCLINFVLAGISCREKTTTTLSDDALRFVKDRCLHRDVSLKIIALDRAGNFIGRLWTNDSEDVALALLREGFANLLENSASSLPSEYKKTEDEAKRKKLRRWANYEEDEKTTASTAPTQTNDDKRRRAKYERVLITEVTPEGTFYAQSYADGAKFEEFQTRMRRNLKKDAYFVIGSSTLPKKNDLLAAKYSYDDRFYRARVEKVNRVTTDTVTTTKIDVVFIDYGNRETVVGTSKTLAALDEESKLEKPYANEYSLACVVFPNDREYRDVAVSCLRQDAMTPQVNNPKAYVNVEYARVSAPPAVTLVIVSRDLDAANASKEGEGGAEEKVKEDDINDAIELKGHNIAKNLVLEGLLYVEERKEGKLQGLIAEYKKAEDEARKNHRNVWEYGDGREDDAKEFGM